MSAKLYQEDIRAMLEPGDYMDAEEILLERCPLAGRKFKALCKNMKGFLDEIKKDFPDACYYTGSGGFNLLLGSSHNDSTRGLDPNQELVALSASNGLAVGDGDW